jgi:hypothetical protein
MISADLLSLSGFEGTSRSSISSLRDVNQGDCNVNNHHTSSTSHIQKPGGLSTGSSERNSVCEVSKTQSFQVPINSDDFDSHPTLNEANQPVFLDEISSSVDGSLGKEEGVLDNCGILPSNCLPCLPSTVPSLEKRRSSSPSPPSSRRKVTSKLSFKWREGNANAFLCEYQDFPLLTY